MGDFTFFHIKHENIWLVALTKYDANAMMIFAFLESLWLLLLECFSVLDADSVRENTILIYELLDEIVDNGYP